MHRAFRYAGSKRHAINIVNEILRDIDTTNSVYVEPFLGSGTIYYNIDKQFNLGLLNDKNSYIMQLHSCFLKYSYEDYAKLLQNVQQDYGNIKVDKEAYIALRSDYNSTWHTPEEDFLKLLLLTNSCMNSMLRFGPNGMNQSFGHCHYIVPKHTWSHLRAKLEDAMLFNMHYSRIFDLLKNKHYNFMKAPVIFVDPPYDGRDMPYSVNGEYSRARFIDELVNLHSICDSPVIMYTDIDNEVSDKLLEHGFKKTVIKQLRSICPNASSEATHLEVLYCNRL